jgi:hypothetical protein
LILLGIVLLGAGSRAIAQNSGILGTVTDESGAVVPGVTLPATNRDTGLKRQTITGEVGQYALPNLEVGVYQVSAERPGFHRQIIDNIALAVQSRAEVNIVLKVGEVSQEVAVSAVASALQTTESHVGTLIEGKMVSELPLNGRNFLQLQLLSPGVVTGKSSTFSAVKIDSQSTSIGGGGFNVNGQRAIFNNYLLDGISFKDWIHGTNGMNPSVDAVQEFRTQTSNFSAEFGSDAGGQVNMVTRSGSNSFHGSLYEFLRNESLDATNFFTNASGLQKDPLSRHQFGGTVGGPVIRDKTFFFFSYDGFRESRSSTLLGNYPSLAMRSGNFSELLNQSTPVQIRDPLTGDPFPGNVVPSSRMLNIWPSYFDKFLPAPNRPGLVNNFATTGTRDNTVDQLIAKVEHQFSDRISVSGRFIHNGIDNIRPRLNPNFGIAENNHDEQLALSAKYTVNPSTLVEYRGGYNLFKQFVNKNLANTTPSIAKDVFKIKGVATDPRASDAPVFSVAGFSGDMGGYHFGPRTWISERYEHHGTFYKTHGKHNIRAGIEAVRHHDTFPEIFYTNGAYTYDGTFSGYSFSDMLLGVPRRYQLSPELFDPQFRYWEIMPWFQDDWRITSSLTLNLGLRYERVGRPVSKHDSISNVRLPAGSDQAFLALAGPCQPTADRKCLTSLPTQIASTRSTLQPDNLNFAPRVGLAYKIGASNKTVLRTGYGIFYQRETINQNVFLSINPPFVSFYDFFVDRTNFQQFDFFDPTRGQPPGGVQFTFIPEPYLDAYSQAWNFGIQREIGPGVVLDVSYVANKATHLPARTNPNQALIGPGPVDPRRPYKNIGVVKGNEPIGNSNYHALQMKGEKRFGQGLTFLASYTFSKAITDSQGAESGEFAAGREPQVNRNLKLNRGLFTADARHRFVFSTLYELPFGKGKPLGSGLKGGVSKVVSGWQLGGIGTFQAGQPLGVTLSFDNPNVGEGDKYPNRIANADNGPKTVQQYFNTAAFVLPPPLTFGNAGVSPVTGPPVKVVDLSLIKNTPVTEKTNFQFRAEAFNVSNHLVMNNPNTVFGTPQFGRVTSTRIDSREIQFGFRFLF